MLRWDRPLSKLIFIGICNERIKKYQRQPLPLCLAHPHGVTGKRAWLEAISKPPSAVDTGNPASFFIKNYGRYAGGNANGGTVRKIKP